MHPYVIHEYTADADYRRVRKDLVSGTVFDLLYDGWRAIEIRNAASQWPFFQSIFGNYLDEQLEADYNGGTPDATCTGAGDAAYGIQNNALFSVYAVTRPDKSINSAFEYDPYGYPTRLIDGNDGDTTVNFNSNDTRAAGIGSTFLHSYTGQLFDAESGLYYYKRRYYHPALGRFISRDLMQYYDTNTSYRTLLHATHLYQYARSNPLLFTDPSGNTEEVPVSKCPKKWRRPKPGRNPAEHVNGCGADGPWWLPGSGPWIPDNTLILRGNIFTEACNKHDACYGTCNSGYLDCNNQLYADMTSACADWYQSLPMWVKPIALPQFLACIAQASAYWVTLDVVGWVAYEAGQEEACICDCNYKPPKK